MPRKTAPNPVPYYLPTAIFYRYFAECWNQGIRQRIIYTDRPSVGALPWDYVLALNAAEFLRAFAHAQPVLRKRSAAPETYLISVPSQDGVYIYEFTGTTDGRAAVQSLLLQPDSENYQNLLINFPPYVLQ